LLEQSDFQKDAKVYAENKYLYKIESAKRGYYIEPNRGQFNDQSRGDNATLFATLYKEGEGELDLLTLGSCCKLDEDGVERYMEQQESIDGQDIVLWYVPRVQNDARAGHEYCWADTVLEDGNLVVKEYPCVVGPKFVPIGDI
jgi:Cu2+-containing amine oxidase